MVYKTIFYSVLLLLSFNSCKESDKPERAKHITIFAAASLSEVIDVVAKEFSIQYGVDVIVNKASSGTLARQLAHGIPGDIYLSANYKWAKYLDSLGVVYKQRLSEVAQNSLVLIAEQGMFSEQFEYLDSASSIIKELKNGRIALGDPLHVPAGAYAKEALIRFGLYQSLEQNIVPTKDVRSALMAVETGEVPFGITYGSDALKSKKVTVVGVFPVSSHSPILYVVAQVSSNPNAFQLYNYLLSEKSQQNFKNHGFKR